MAGYPYLPLWVNAFLGDTMHMDNRECGAYLLLLMVAWKKSDGGLPDDDKILARWARCSKSEWARVKPAVMAFWTKDARGDFIQKRLEIERTYVVGRTQKASAAANAKWLKEQQKRDADALSGQNRSSRQASALIPIPRDTLTSNHTDPARAASLSPTGFAAHAKPPSMNQRMAAIAAKSRKAFVGNA